MNENEYEEEYELSPETAHPAASALLTEDFFWSESDDTSPFGSDDGSDAFRGFREWRLINQTVSPFAYIGELLNNWGYNDTPAIEDPEMAGYLIERAASGTNQVIIAVGLGQFVLEGAVDKDLLAETRQAIEREFDPVMINLFVEHQREKRLAHLNILLKTVDKIAAL